jgi:hypothetical protein
LSGPCDCWGRGRAGDDLDVGPCGQLLGGRGSRLVVREIFGAQDEEPA